MSFKRPKLICVTGIDGSGKSTLVNKLNEEIKNSKIVTIWDLMKKPSLRECFSFKSKEDIDRYLEQLHHPARALFMFHCLAEPMTLAFEEAKEKGTEVLLLDGYWFKYAASEIAFGANPDEIRGLAKVFPDPDLVLYIEIDSKVALSRKKTFSGYEGGYDPGRTEQGFIDFQSRSHQMMKMLVQNQKVKVLNGLDSVENKLLLSMQEIAQCK